MCVCACMRAHAYMSVCVSARVRVRMFVCARERECVKGKRGEALCE